MLGSIDLFFMIVWANLLNTPVQLWWLSWWRFSQITTEAIQPSNTKLYNKYFSYIRAHGRGLIFTTAIPKPLCTESPPSIMTRTKNHQVIQLSQYTSESKLSVTLASAFKDDPITTYPFGKFIPIDIEKRLTSVFDSVFKFAISKNTTIHCSADEKSVAIWFHDDGWKDKSDQLGVLLSLMKLYRWNIFKFLKISDCMVKNHPKEPHLYLYFIGTHDNYKGKGMGSSVICKMLQRCDQEGLPVYLESSSKMNIPFYERHGFVVKHQLPGLPKHCPPFTAMWREPQTSDDQSV